jgi:ComF family protein
MLTEELCEACGREKEHCVCKHDHFITDGIAAPFYFKDSVKTAVYRFKELEDNDQIQYFADMVADAVYRVFGSKKVDYITCVPLHRTTFIERGFNQAENLASVLSKKLYTPFVSLLKKRYKTASQKGLLAAERKGNVLGAFDVCTDIPLKGKNIILVDDVITTGATTNECAKMLKIYGANNVYAVAIALTKPDDRDPIAEIRRRLERERMGMENGR